MGRVSMESLCGGISIQEVEERQDSPYHGLSIMLAFGRSLFAEALNWYDYVESKNKIKFKKIKKIKKKESFSE